MNGHKPSRADVRLAEEVVAMEQTSQESRHVLPAYLSLGF